MIRLRRFVGGLHWNSVRPSDANSNLLNVSNWGGRGGFPKNLVTQVTIIFLTNLLIINNSFAKENKNIYKQEYFRQLDYSFDQAYCLFDLMYQENRNWDPKAKNGSHYGLPQGRSKFLSRATYRQQITWHVNYIKNRYGTDTFGTANVCAAYAHWLLKGWH